MPLLALALPNDIHLVVQQAQQPQILEPQPLTPNNPNVTAPKGGQAGITPATKPSMVSNKAKFSTFFQGYFDAGASDLIGTFSTQVFRYGVRSGQHDLHAYVRNETLDTTSTNLPFRSIVQGFGGGIGYRYWFPGNKLFFTTQLGYIFSGFNKDKTDLRVGFAGYTNSTSEKWFSDIYGDFFYVDLAKDVFLSARGRSGIILNKNRDGVLSTYLVGQTFFSGKGLSGTENRIEGGFGFGYTFRNAVSANVELRAGYAYRGLINDRAYLNPQIILSGGF